jgi:hypothetical protein
MSEKEMSPAEREARQMIADKKAQEAATKAYNAADKTPPAPKAEKKEKYDLSSRVGMNALVEKKASGGSVGSASKRADGIASRGKTKCKMY